jgi:MATE family multidrug resistance protein
MGSNKISELRKLGTNALWLTSVFMIIFAIIFVVFRFQMVGWFNEKPEVIGIAATLMIIAAIFQLSDGVQAVSLGLLRGMEDTKFPALLTFVVYYLVVLPLCYYLGIYIEMGMIGIWIALSIGLTLAAVLLITRFYSLQKRLIILQK